MTIQFYYNPLSPNARRVWLTLLEKSIPFEPILLKLDGDQSAPDFLQINPFGHIPVLVDEGLRLVESLAILDYLEAKYLQPALLPTSAEAIATVRMVQMLTANELFPLVIALLFEPPDTPQPKTRAQLAQVLSFFAQLLGDRPYFGSQQLTLGDIVAGAAMPILLRLGISLSPYPQLEAWYQRLQGRESWQQTEMSAEDFERWKRRVKLLVKLRQRARNRQLQSKSR